jgi:hypothetical protein
MGFLDLWERDRELSSRFQPGEGTELPSFYELHRQEILMFGAMLLVAAAAFLAIRYRGYLRALLIVSLAVILKARRKTTTHAQLFWKEVEDRAKESR